MAGGGLWLSGGRTVWVRKWTPEPGCCIQILSRPLTRSPLPASVDSSVKWAYWCLPQRVVVRFKRANPCKGLQFMWSVLWAEGTLMFRITQAEEKLPSFGARKRPPAVFRPCGAAACLPVAGTTWVFASSGSGDTCPPENRPAQWTSGLQWAAFAQLTVRAAVFRDTGSELLECPAGLIVG